MIMVSQNDLGSSLMFFTLFVVMLWVATSRTSYLVVGAALFGAAVLHLVAHSSPTCKERVTIWLNPWKDPPATGYQPVKAAFAMANGGLAGTGLGLGNQDSIPYIQTDFIFAAIAQQLGLFGATLVIVAFMLIVGSGLRIAARADQAFDKLLAVGLTTLIGVQSFIIIAGVTRLLPLTGLALPVRLLRRLVAGVELGPDRAAAAHLRRIESPGRRARRWRPRSTGDPAVAAREHPDPPTRHRAARLLPGPVRDAQLDPGRAQAVARQQRRSTTCASSSSSTRTAAPSRSADGAVLAQSVDVERLVRLQAPARVPAGRPVRVSSRASTRSTTAPPDSSRPTTRELSGQTVGPADQRASPTCSTRGRRSAT